MADEIRLRTLVKALGGTLHGDGDVVLRGIAPLESAGAADIAFVARARFAAQIDATQAAALIVTPELLPRAAARGPCIETPDPYLYYARLSQWWRQRHPAPGTGGIHPSAWVDPTAMLGRDCQLGAFAVVEAGAQLGDGVTLAAHAVVQAQARIGAGSRIGAHAVVGHGCSVGARCIVHGGAVIGADGFGFAPDQGRWEKIEQLGAVRIGDDVEIGANTCIDRGALGDTVLEDGVKLDNLIQIGHNVHVGAHTAMAGCVGVAGSARIGAGCTVGGGAVVLGHLSLADGVHISAASVVMRSILKAGHYSGVFPIDDNASWEKNAATLRQLHKLRERVRDLEKKTP